MEDTIAAIASAPGEGGIGIVRISGDRSFEIMKQIFQTVDNKKETQIVNRRLTYGHIIDHERNHQVVDEVMAVFMKGPHTYTTEDVVEIDCHGSMISLRNILALVLRRGARLAEKGEFTKRAFLNGRIDLVQAEAVIDLVRSKTDRSFDAAMDQMNGRLSQKIRQVRKDLMDLLALIIVHLDYPEEDLEEIAYHSLTDRFKTIMDEIRELLADADTGRMLREGVGITIVGKPNVGKSSLMNAMLRESRAIVTEIPGTTRDTIEEGIQIRGIPIRLTDTAGIRQTDDLVEQMGISRSREAVKGADLILFLLDGSRPLSKEDRQIGDGLEGKSTLILINKSDLKQIVTEEEALALVPEGEVMATSMNLGQGIRQIEDRVEEFVWGGRISPSDSVLVTNVRHKELLSLALDSIVDAAAMAESKEALDFIEVDVRRGWELLGQITGDSVTDDLIGEVFSRFCLGK